MTTADNYNFYQSPLRIHINRDIFLKPAFQVDFEWKSYQVICKEKKILWVILVRFQILWIDSWLISDNQTMQSFKESVLQWANSYYNGKKYITLYIQCWFTNVLVKNNVSRLKANEQACISEYITIKKKSDNQKLSRGLKQSRKHNLPDSTIVIDLSRSHDQLWSDVWRNTKEKIKKTEKLIQKGELLFRCSYEVLDYDLFFDLYCKTAGNKWFGAITLWMREKLKKIALDKWFSRLFIISDTSWVAVSAAFCILENNVLTYLYGANDRRYGNAWVSQYLHRNIIQYAQDNAIRYYDLLWASGLGSKNDRLEQVTQFKLGFGWEKLEYAWSRDLVVNRIAYRMYSFMG